MPACAISVFLCCPKQNQASVLCEECTSINGLPLLLLGLVLVCCYFLQEFAVPPIQDQQRVMREVFQNPQRKGVMGAARCLRAQGRWAASCWELSQFVYALRALSVAALSPRASLCLVLTSHFRVVVAGMLSSPFFNSAHLHKVTLLAKHVSRCLAATYAKAGGAVFESCCSGHIRGACCCSHCCFTRTRWIHDRNHGQGQRVRGRSGEGGGSGRDLCRRGGCVERRAPRTRVPTVNTPGNQ